MRYASVRHEGRPLAGLVDGEELVPLRGITELGTATPCEVLADPPLDEAARLPLTAVRLRPVVPRPGKIICLGLNYRPHVEETGRELPTYPVLFTKFAESLVAHGAPIVAPPESSEMDYEAELAIVVGRALRRAGPEEALAGVAGCTIANDISMRDFQYRTHQWLQGKAWEAATPLGPHLVTLDELGDAGSLAIRLRLNGETMQDDSTARMIFDVPTILGHLSTFVTLQPGDVILTGTPGGVGSRRDPKVTLVPGDRIEVEIERLGVLANEVAAEV